MMKIAMAGTCMAALVLGACASQADKIKMGMNQPADVGEMPAGYEAELIAITKARLKDPYSAHIDVGVPQKMTCNLPFIGPHYGWRVAVIVNAKNGFGAYTGEQVTYFWYSGGKIDRIALDDGCGTAVDARNW